jgi:SAM-dependent methyltransferase
MTAPEDSIRAAYDTVAADYTVLFKDALRSNVFDRAMLGAFAEIVLADGGGRVADLGCGPGRITGPLHELGLDVSGIDVSPAMVAVAREALPHVSFEVGSMLALGLADGGLAAVVAWYSVIHTAPERQPALFRELARVLRPQGHLLLAFQVGDERVHLDHVYGHDVSLDVYRLRPDDVAGLLDGAGFEVTARLVREPVGPERQPQAYLVARRR